MTEIVPVATATFTLALLSLTVLFTKNARNGTKNKETPYAVYFFYIGSFLSIVLAVLFAFWVHYYGGGSAGFGWQVSEADFRSYWWRAITITTWVGAISLSISLVVDACKRRN